MLSETREEASLGSFYAKSMAAADPTFVETAEVAGCLPLTNPIWAR